MIERQRRVLMFVAAHPDDDVVGVGGVVALHRDDPFLRFVLIHATDGEAGEIAPGSGATRATLGAVRREEDRAGWRVIGRMPDRHEWFGFPDGALASLPTGVLERRITDVLAEERPDVVMTFGPDGITGHPDHIAVGAAASASFLRFTADGGPGFHRLLHGAYPQSALDRLNAHRQARGLPPYDPGRVFHPRALPDADVACTVDQRGVVPVIAAAFRMHRSQFVAPWADYDDRDWLAAAGENHMVQAWPPWSRGTRKLRDPMDGL